MEDLFRISRGRRIYLFLSLLMIAVIWALPFVALVGRSLLGDGWENYRIVLTRDVAGVSLYRTWLNSFVNAMGSGLIVTLVSSLAGFAYSKTRFIGRQTLYILTIGCLAIPVVTLIVPLFFIVLRVGLFDTYFAVILPEVALTLPFGVLMMKNFYDALPDELKEAAVMDGAGNFRIYFSVFQPLASYSLVNLFLLQFIWSVKDFLVPLVLTVSNEMVTATLAVSRFQNAFVTTLGGIGTYSASIILLAVPMVILFVLTQQMVSRGLVAGSVKS